jgi:hypothetical protein
MGLYAANDVKIVCVLYPTHRKAKTKQVATTHFPRRLIKEKAGVRRSPSEGRGFIVNALTCGMLDNKERPMVDV